MTANRGTESVRIDRVLKEKAAEYASKCRPTVTITAVVEEALSRYLEQFKPAVPLPTDAKKDSEKKT